MWPLRTTAATVILPITAVTVPSAWRQHRRASCVPAVGSTPWSKDRENGGFPRLSEAVVSRSRAGEPSTSHDTPPGDHLERPIPQAPAPGNLASGSAVRPSPAGEPPARGFRRGDTGSAVNVLLGLRSHGPLDNRLSRRPPGQVHRPALCLRSLEVSGALREAVGDRWRLEDLDDLVDFNDREL